MAQNEPENQNGSTGAANAQSPKSFDPKTLDRTVLAGELIETISTRSSAELLDVIIDLNLEFPEGREEAKRRVEHWIRERLDSKTARDVPTSGAGAAPSPMDALGEGVDVSKTKFSQQYIFARLSAGTIRDLADTIKRPPAGAAATDQSPTGQTLCEKGKSPIYKIWLDHDLTPFMNVSICTVKADAARAAFGADGTDIVWAVADSGVDGCHRHFVAHNNLNDLPSPLQHRDFTVDGSRTEKELKDSALIDVFGHGTHVAGIIAGEVPATDKKKRRSTTKTAEDNQQDSKYGDSGIRAFYREKDDSDDVKTRVATLSRISGMAPQSKLLSLKVLDDRGVGKASNLIAAIEYIQFLNGNGRRVRVHGLNISVGYSFKPEWFACGQSPLCVEIDRLVRSGVCVVVAAGNDGYGFVTSENSMGGAPAGLSVTIADPGNADLAITVGSTHREMPHTYGVSYFSSKGPTGDGRFKPDLLAPGEKIISCMSSQMAPEKSKLDRTLVDSTLDVLAKAKIQIAAYREDSGTSMAAPHVSGVIAAFLSNRREFIGRPETVKELFLSSASDLKRAPYFQGKGLVDLMRAIQSV